MGDIIREVEMLGYKVGEYIGEGSMKRVFYCRHDDHREQLVVKFSRGSSAHEKEIKIAQKLRNHFGDEADRILIPSYHHVTIQIGDDSPMNHWTAEIQPAVTRYQDNGPDNRWTTEGCCSCPRKRLAPGWKNVSDYNSNGEDMWKYDVPGEMTKFTNVKPEDWKCVCGKAYEQSQWTVLH